MTLPPPRWVEVVCLHIVLDGRSKAAVWIGNPGIIVVHRALRVAKPLDVEPVGAIHQLARVDCLNVVFLLLGRLSKELLWGKVPRVEDVHAVDMDTRFMAIL